ncbi:uncharacterized protein F4807DRAFT_442895 [Annulohypoxylon truncatum]|uniref:uncharacterized protein n=1 Tax=Annulohypoxylon truncatum TaxID=327061 RepID=UPI00200792F9|nr:uncharacterized protein F4807DRAFT_442895 [Annulohypoxylon truncatum]KAI1205522.1 hypothetical protein F4807DRAFT_442895 [Annulohypoxylon truncatum]
MEQIEHPPPPYSPGPNAAPSTNQPQNLEPWQRRWNREWFKHAFVKNFRRKYANTKLPSKNTGRVRRKVIGSIIVTSAHINEGVTNGVTGEEDDISMSRWHRTMNRLFGHIKWKYEEFLEWRQDRKEEKKLWKVTAIMEDTGDSPKWKGVMTFKIPREHWAKFDKEHWFQFPSPENIKWFWVKRPDSSYDGEDFVQPSHSHWGPDLSSLDIVIPFRQTRGGVVRNSTFYTPDLGYWNNFVEGGGRATFL